MDASLLNLWPQCVISVCVCLVPPDAMVSGYDQSWSVNQKGAELKCEGVGNPQPHNFTWTRYILPVSVYQCVFVCVFVFALQKT